MAMAMAMASIGSGGCSLRCGARSQSEASARAGVRVRVRVRAAAVCEKAGGHLLMPMAPILPLSSAVMVAADAGPANAITSQDLVDSFVRVQGVTQEITGYIGGTYAPLKEFLEKVFFAVQPTVDVVVPFLQKATDAAIKTTTPVVYDVARQAEKSLQSVGVDTKPVVAIAKTAVTVASEVAETTSKVFESASPVASSALESLLASDPFILAGGSGGLLLLYFLAPSIGSSIAYAARGYKGNLTAAQALDLLSKEDYTLIDIRTQNQKIRSGVPNLPKSSNRKLLAIPLEELASKLKRRLRNASKVEAEIVAIKVSSLKKLRRGSKIVILDSVGDKGKLVARSLTDLGFKNSWVIADGFDGGRGWVHSKLGTSAYNSSFTEVVSPSTIIPAPITSKKLLPSASSHIRDSTPRQTRLLPTGFSKES